MGYGKRSGGSSYGNSRGQSGFRGSKKKRLSNMYNGPVPEGGFPKDEYGYTQGSVYATRIHEFGGKFILDVASAGTGNFSGEHLFKKTYNSLKDAEEAAQAYLKVQIY